jgi:hypothetical protein
MIFEWMTKKWAVRLRFVPRGSERGLVANSFANNNKALDSIKAGNSLSSNVTIIFKRTAVFCGLG